MSARGGPAWPRRLGMPGAVVLTGQVSGRTDRRTGGHTGQVSGRTDRRTGWYATPDASSTTVDDTVTRVTGRPARTFAQWVDEHADRFQAGSLPRRLAGGSRSTDPPPGRRSATAPTTAAAEPLPQAGDDL